MALSILLVLGLSAILVITGAMMRPGLGIIGAIVIISLTMWLRGHRVADIGLGAPVDWVSTVILSLLLGSVISVLSWVLITPLSEILTNTSHDYGRIHQIKGDWRALVQILIFVWLFVAVVEEVIFRGFLMNEIFKVVGTGLVASIFAVGFTSIVFAYCHAYQNSSGIVTTGIISAILGIVYLFTGKNLWVVILTHGFIDTIGILTIYFGADQFFRQLLWKVS